MTGDENRPALSGTSGIAAWHEDVCIHVPSPNREPACVVEHAEKRYTNSRYFWIWARTFQARSRRGPRPSPVASAVGVKHEAWVKNKRAHLRCPPLAGLGRPRH